MNHPHSERVTIGTLQQEADAIASICGKLDSALYLEVCRTLENLRIVSGPLHMPDEGEVPAELVNIIREDIQRIYTPAEHPFSARRS